MAEDALMADVDDDLDNATTTLRMPSHNRATQQLTGGSGRDRKGGIQAGGSVEDHFD